MGKSPKKSKNSQKSQQQTVDMLSLYSRLNELSKDELIFLKQQLIEQQKVQQKSGSVGSINIIHQQQPQQQTQTQQITSSQSSTVDNQQQQRGKSKKKKVKDSSNNNNIIAQSDEPFDITQKGIMSINHQNSKLYIMAASASAVENQVMVGSTKNSNNKGGVGGFHNNTQTNNHHMESVNIYLQASSAGKKIKKTFNAQMKKRRNMDLIDVCNESTIMGKSKIEEDQQEENQNIIQNEDNSNKNHINEIIDAAADNRDDFNKITEMLQEQQNNYEETKLPLAEHQVFAISSDVEPLQPSFNHTNNQQQDNSSYKSNQLSSNLPSKDQQNSPQKSIFQQQQQPPQNKHNKQNKSKSINQRYDSSNSNTANNNNNNNTNITNITNSSSINKQSNQNFTNSISQRQQQIMNSGSTNTTVAINNIGLSSKNGGLLNSKKLIDQQIISNSKNINNNDGASAAHTSTSINVLNSQKLSNGFNSTTHNNNNNGASIAGVYGQNENQNNNGNNTTKNKQQYDSNINKIVSNRNNIQSRSIDSQQLIQQAKKQNNKKDSSVNASARKQLQSNSNKQSQIDLENKFTNLQAGNKNDLLQQEQQDIDKIKEEISSHQLSQYQNEYSRQLTNDLKNHDDELEDTQYLLNYQGIDPQLQNNKSSTNQQQTKLQLNQDNQIISVDQPYVDALPIQPNSTKAKDNFHFQNQPNQSFNPQQTQPNFHQVQNTLIKKTGKTKQLQQQDQLSQQQQALQTKKQQKLDSIICLAVSVEPYLKRNMQKLGWLDTTNPSQFHIRFDITDKEGSQNKLRNAQWYNHFPNNRELTTKAGLCKNLWQQCSYDYELQIAEFFPRCYDLSDQKQIDLFVLDFQQTAILSIIKIYANYFLNKTKKLLTYLQKYKDKEQYTTQKVYKSKLKFECSRYDQLVSGAGSMLGNDTLRLSMLYAKQHILSKQKIDRKQKSYTRKFTDEELQMMVEYSYLLVSGEEGINSKFPIYEQIKTIIYHEKLQQYLPQYQTIDGTSNVWVVKPSYNARGLGVYCANKLKDIIQQGKKSQSKIVQKYIENPYLLNKKKFDIRQWALVTSWEPLDVYVFQSAYLKICGSEFTLQNLSDQYRHLSNFTIQKNNKQAGQYDDFVMSHDQFSQYVQQNSSSQYPQFTWTEDLFPKIQDVVYKTLKGVQDSMEQRPNTFEIYGFDLILDENLHPWVIEVNLSPACNERSEFLTQMLDDMSLDLLQYVENKIIMQNNVETEWISNFKEKKEQLYKKQASQNLSMSLNDEQFYLENNLKHRWIRIQDCVQDLKNYQLSQNIMQAAQLQKCIQQPLELLGQKVSVNIEKKIDKHYMKMKSLQLIQRYYRGYRGRKVYKKLLQNQKSIIIQKYLRQHLAIKHVFKMKQHKSAIIIQKYLRQYNAKLQVNQLIQTKIHNAKQFVALKLQSQYRRFKAKQVYINLLKHHKATIIKKYIRSMRAKKLVKQKLTFKTLVVRIQRFYKKRYQMRKKNAIQIQKYLKGFAIQKKVKKLQKINKGSQQLLKVFKAHKTSQALKSIKMHNNAIKIQSIIKMFIQKRRYTQLLKEKAQKQIQRISLKYLSKQLKAFSYEFRYNLNIKVTLIQKYLRQKLALNKVQNKKLLKLQQQKSIIVQKYLRAYNAKSLVQFRLRQKQCIIKIQAFFRKLLAQKKLRRLQKIKTKRDTQRQKDIEKKFQKTNRIEKDIENYIESLFHREISQQNKMKQILSQTPISSQPRLGQAQQHHQMSRESLQIRQSFTSQTNIQRNYQDNTSNISPDTVSTNPTTASQNIHRLASQQDQKIQKAIQESEILSSKMLSRVQLSNHQDNAAYDCENLQKSPQQYDENEILATSVIMDDNGNKYSKTDQNTQNNHMWNTIDRQQKPLKIRKQKKQSTVQQPLNNLVTNKGTKSYQKEFNQRMTQALHRVQVQTNSNSNTQRANSMVPFGSKNVHQNVPKPKTFAENLMNMLALQNIGQAFSENPVEALGILKQESRVSGGGASTSDNRHVVRRNSNASRGGAAADGTSSNNHSFVTQSVKNTNNNQSVISTIDGTSQKSIQFPKLNDFKSATNNIYLANRPVADPRADAEYQYQVLEQKLRKTQGTAFHQDTASLNKSSNALVTNSRSDLHTNITQPVSQQQQATSSTPSDHTRSLNTRQSSENLTKGGFDKKFLDDFKYDNNQMLMQPRPRDQTHLMVVQAYKKQQQPTEHHHGYNKKSKKQQNRGDSMGLPGGGSKSTKKTSYQQFSETPSAEKSRQNHIGGFAQATASFKKSSSNNNNDNINGFIPPITDNGNRLVII